MINAHQYGCPCPNCTTKGANAYDQRNTARGGSTRAAWTVSPTVKAQQSKRHGNLLVASWIMQQLHDRIRTDIRNHERRARRQAWRADLAKARPGAWSEIRRAVSEWWHAEIKTNRDAIETMAAGLCMVAACAAILSPLFRMAMGVAR